MEDASDDEFFGAQDDADIQEIATFNGSMTQRNAHAKQEELRKVAFLDAYDQYKESKLQEGFESGMTETFDVASRIGKMLGKASTLSKLQQKSTPNKSSNADNVDKATGTVREFFADTFQNKVSEESSTQQLEGLETNLKTILHQRNT